MTRTRTKPRRRRTRGTATPSPTKLASFQEFEASVASLPTEQERGDAFERFVHAYLLLNREFALTDVWPISETPLPVLKKLGLPRSDVGVDFVALRRDRALWAVQAKFRIDRSPVTWRELSTFAGASQRAAHRLLIGNQRRLPRRAPSLDNFGAELRSALARLDADFFKRWAEWERGRAPKPPKRLPPRPDQRQAIQQVAKHFKSGEPRAQLIAACGTGKTLTALWIAEELDAKRTIAFMPSLALVHQTLKAWSEQADPERPLDALCVCSDVTVGDVHPRELPIPVTTEARQVRQFWSRRALPGTRRVVLATYQSVEVMKRALRKQSQADLLIADEAHRIAGREGKPFQEVLHDRAIPAKRRLFMTATPRILAPHHRKRAEEEGTLIASMDDPARFGEVAYELPFGKAIELRLLADYDINVLGVTDAEVRRLVKKRVVVDASGERIDAETLAQVVALSKAIRKGLIRYAFTFHHTKKNASTFIDALLVVTQIPKGRLFANSIFGTMPVAERQEILLEMLSADKGVVSSARALTEGVDAPAVDAVVFVDPKSSVVDIAQAVGRALRRDPANPTKQAHIVMPVVLEDSEDPEEELERSAWEPVWRVLTAMRAHDQRLADELDAAQRERGMREVSRRGRGDEASPIRCLHLDLPRHISLPRFRRAVALRVLDEAADRFELGFGVLRAYVARVGDALVPQAHMERDFKLGLWVMVRRQLRRQGRLSEDRAALLEALPGWSWDPLEDQFQDGLRVLQQFADRRGHAIVSFDWVENGFPLGIWVGTRRRDWKRGLLAPEHKALLEAFPGWSWDPLEARHRKNLAKLEEFVARVGDARVPQAHMEGDFPLGDWVTSCRQRRRQGRLSEDLAAALEALDGWTWDAKEAQFQDGLRVLQQFVDRTGDARVPSSGVENGFPLGSWVNTRRMAWKRGLLAPEHKALLEALPGWSWDPLEDRFRRNLATLKEFVEREGRANVPSNHIEGSVKLGMWVADCRKGYRKGTLPSDRIAALEALDGWTWDPLEDQFQDGLLALQQFVDRTGDARVPARHREGAFGLGQWVHRLRREYKRGALSQERIAALEGIPGWMWSTQEARRKRTAGRKRR